MQSTSKPNERCCRIFRDLPPKFLPPKLQDDFKTPQFFFYLTPSEIEKVCWTKTFPFQAVPFFLSLSVSHHFIPFISQMSFFEGLKLNLGGKQTKCKTFSRNEKFECFRCFFHIATAFKALQLALFIPGGGRGVPPRFSKHFQRKLDRKLFRVKCECFGMVLVPLVISLAQLEDT